MEMEDETKKNENGIRNNSFESLAFNLVKFQMNQFVYSIQYTVSFQLKIIATEFPLSSQSKQNRI